MLIFSVSRELDGEDIHDVRLKTRLQVSDSAWENSEATDSNIKQDELYSTVAAECAVSTDITTHCMYDCNMLKSIKHAGEQPYDTQAGNDYNRQGDGIHDHVVKCLPSVKCEEHRQELNEQSHVLPFHSTDQEKSVACDVCEPIQVKQEATEDPDGYDRHNESTRHWIVCPGGVLKEIKSEHTSDVSDMLSVEGCNENVGGKPSTHTCTHLCNRVKPFTCDTCGKSFAQLRYLKAHERTHRGIKPFTCDTCGESFANLEHLTNHKGTHTGVKAFTCDTCGKSFAQLRHLNVHKRIHTGVKHFTCDTCGKSFAYSKALEVHNRTHTWVKPFTCDTCGKSFAHSGYLKMHKRKHTGLKPFTCDPCGISFAQLGQLTCHQRTHTGVKPFTCDTCGKSYIASGHLIRHEMTHTCTKQFTCDKCGKSFTVSRHLKWHQMTHRSVIPFTLDTIVKPVACDTGVNL